MVNLEKPEGEDGTWTDEQIDAKEAAMTPEQKAMAEKMGSRTLIYFLLVFVGFFLSIFCGAILATPLVDKIYPYVLGHFPVVCQLSKAFCKSEGVLAMSMGGAGLILFVVLVYLAIRATRTVTVSAAPKDESIRPLIPGWFPAAIWAFGALCIVADWLVNGEKSFIGLLVWGFAR